MYTIQPDFGGADLTARLLPINMHISAAFTQGTKVHSLDAVIWRKNRCLQCGCKSLPRGRPVGRLAQDFQLVDVQFQVRASEFFGTSIALSPQLSSQLQRCYGKKTKQLQDDSSKSRESFLIVEVKSWFTKKRERERRHDGKKMEQSWK